jgi:hypothetical protein
VPALVLTQQDGHSWALKSQQATAAQFAAEEWQLVEQLPWAPQLQALMEQLQMEQLQLTQLQSLQVQSDQSMPAVVSSGHGCWA